MPDQPSIDDRTKRIKARWEQLKAKRQDFDTNYFIPIQQYVLPKSGYFTDVDDPSTHGRIRGVEILNNHAQRAWTIGAAGMHGGMTSPFRQWFDLALLNKNLSELGAVKAHLEHRKELYYRTFSTTNFYREIHKFHGERIGYGTAVTMVEEDIEKTCHFKTMTMGQFWIAENQKGKVDTVYRRLDMSAAQIIDEFGKDEAGETIKNAMESGNDDEMFEILHAVQPRRKRDYTKQDNRNMPYESIYILLGGVSEKKGKELGQPVLRESGYEMFPFIVGRYDVVPGEVYGRCPGMDVLPEARQLQSLEADLDLMIEKNAKPPIKKPASMEDVVINDLPGGVTTYDGADARGLDRLYEVNPRIDELEKKILRVEQAISRAFYNDIFMLSEAMGYGQPPTREEIVERRQEKLLLLGPTVEGMDSETLQPLIDLVDYHLGDSGQIEEPPRELIGQQVRLVMVSQMAQAQRVAKTRNIQATSAYFAELANLTEEVLDNLDTDEAGRQFAEAVGGSNSLIVPLEEVKRKRQARAERQARQAQIEAAQMQLNASQQAAGTLKTASDVNADAIQEFREASNVI